MSVASRANLHHLAFRLDRRRSFQESNRQRQRRCRYRTGGFPLSPGLLRFVCCFPGPGSRKHGMGSLPEFL